MEWFRRETQRVLQIVQPTEVIEGDKEVVAILKHLAKYGETCRRKVAQYERPFKGDGGMERAEKKLEEMLQKGQLIGEVRKSGNGMDVKWYSLSGRSTLSTSTPFFIETDETWNVCLRHFFAPCATLFEE